VRGLFADDAFVALSVYWTLDFDGALVLPLPNGARRVVELHWYQVHGKGQRDIKIKRYLDEA